MRKIEGRGDTVRRKKAFSLIELLVVIAVLAILAGFLFPVFAQARDRGRAAACLSNLRQIGMAAMMYAQDYDEIYPKVLEDYLCPLGAYWGLNAAGTGFCPWHALIQPYLKSLNILQCPSSSWRNTLTAYDGITYPLVIGGNYAMNQVFGYREGPTVSLATVEQPADTIFALDAWELRHVTYTMRPLQFNLNPTPDYPGDYEPADRHAGGNNVVFADGHAHWLSAREARCTERWYFAGGAYTYEDDLKTNPAISIFKCH